MQKNIHWSENQNKMTIRKRRKDIWIQLFLGKLLVFLKIRIWEHFNNSKNLYSTFIYIVSIYFHKKLMM